MQFTSISILEETKKQLFKLKIHPRETWDDLIKRLISKDGMDINRSV